MKSKVCITAFVSTNADEFQNNRSQSLENRKTIVASGLGVRICLATVKRMHGRKVLCSEVGLKKYF